MNWESLRLSGICGDDSPITYGILQPGPDLETGVPYVRPSEIKDEQIDISSIRRTSPEIAGRYKKSTIRKGDILITIVGTIGKIAMVPSALDGGNITQSSARLRICPSKADRHYVKNFLRSSYARRQYDQHRLGVAVPRLNLHHVRDLRIPLPPLDEQKRIATILDAADALRTKRRECLAQLDTFLQSTFLDTFGDPVTNPMGWELQPLQDLLKEKSINGAYYPKDAYSDDGTSMVHMADAFYGVVNPNNVRRVDAPAAEVVKYALRPTDLLVSRRSLKYEGSAKPCLIPDANEPLIFESSLIRVRPDLERILTIYLFHYLQNDRARARYVFPMVTRSTISGISQSNLMKVKVVLPPIELQRRFAAIVETVEQQKARQRAHLTELDTLFASLQSRAFRGDL